MNDPPCPRCGNRMPLLFHVQRYCRNNCDKMPPGPPCPKCKSTVTELMVTQKIDGRTQAMHCWPCGAVWDEQDISWED